MVLHYTHIRSKMAYDRIIIKTITFVSQYCINMEQILRFIYCGDISLQ